MRFFIILFLLLAVVFTYEFLQDNVEAMATCQIAHSEATCLNELR